MSAQTRFRTLVQHIGRIYSAKDEGGSRTELLQSGLNEIMTVIGPKDSKGWATVTADSERLLHIWVAKESDSTAAAVSTQLVNLLKELASHEEEVEHPALIVSETRSQPDIIRHSGGFMDSLAPVSSFPLPVSSFPLPVSSTLSFPVASRFVPEPISSVLVETKEDLEEEDVREINIVNEEKVEEEEVVEEEVEEVEEEEEVVEPEEEEVEEEEEEGMEVEKYFHRGRSYWRDTNSDKLYAVIDGDEVGDEVGALVGGKPQFLAA
jgi:hypothetical protein